MSTAPDPITGELVEVMDREAAEKVTRDIKAWAGTLWLKIEEAHRGRAWLALGYETWEAYLDAEFDISRSRGYRLVTHATVVRTLSAAAGLESPMGDIPERQTRNLDLDAASEEVSTNVDALPEDATDEDRGRVVKETLTRHYESDEDRRKRQHGEVLAAIAQDPEADNATIAERCGCSVVVVRAVRREIDQSPPTPPGDETGAGVTPAPEPAPDGADEGEPEDMPVPPDPGTDGEDAPPATSPSGPDDLALYLINALKAESATRKGLLTFDPERLVMTSRDHGLWLDLIADLRKFADDLTAAVAAARPLRRIK